MGGNIYRCIFTLLLIHLFVNRRNKSKNKRVGQFECPSLFVVFVSTHAYIWLVICTAAMAESAATGRAAAPVRPSVRPSVCLSVSLPDRNWCGARAAHPTISGASDGTQLHTSPATSSVTITIAIRHTDYLPTLVIALCAALARLCFQLHSFILQLQQHSVYTVHRSHVFTLLIALLITLAVKLMQVAQFSDRSCLFT